MAKLVYQAERSHFLQSAIGALVFCAGQPAANTPFLLF
jgi:hypothetical protein